MARIKSEMDYTEANHELIQFDGDGSERAKKEMLDMANALVRFKAAMPFSFMRDVSSMARAHCLADELRSEYGISVVSHHVPTSPLMLERAAEMLDNLERKGRSLRSSGICVYYSQVLNRAISEINAAVRQHTEGYDTIRIPFVTRAGGNQPKHAGVVYPGDNVAGIEYPAMS